MRTFYIIYNMSCFHPNPVIYYDDKDYQKGLLFLNQEFKDIEKNQKVNKQQFLKLAYSKIRPEWYSFLNQVNRKYGAGFFERHAIEKIPGQIIMTIPCGKCLGCLADRSRDWGIRCIKEQQTHENACFITLTYDDEHLPSDELIHGEDATLFLKRFRYYLDDNKIRYFGCSEYGSKFGRPHFHFIIFGWDGAKEDGDLWNDEQGFKNRSRLLDKAWRKGATNVAPFTIERAIYVAKYTTKRALETPAFILDKEKIAPQRTLCSRMPGIAKEWFNQYWQECERNFLIHKNLKYKIPRVFDKWMEKEHPELYEKIKTERLLNACNSEINTHELAMKEVCKIEALHALDENRFDI